MEQIKDYISYLTYDKRASRNTIMSYNRDLKQMASWFSSQGIIQPSEVTSSHISSYILYMENAGKATTSISRTLASMKAFFAYEVGRGMISTNPTDGIKSPKVQKKAPTVLTVEEVDRFLAQPVGSSAKVIRDRAMLELLYATGIRVSEIISLKVDDVNFSVGFITCKDGAKERAIPFGKSAREALLTYLGGAREKLLKGMPSDMLFINCNGKAMSRQGFWKIIKFYGDKAGIQTDITPQSLRHSFAVHLIRNGADIKAVQEMLGHSDVSTTHAYVNYIQNPGVREAYVGAHPRK